MITVCVHTKGSALQHGATLGDIDEILRRPDELVWVDALDPSADELETLRAEFGFHRLAIEDVDRFHQRPKVDFYDTFILIIFYSVTFDAKADEKVTPTQLGIFLGKNYVVTVHDEVVPALEETVDRWRKNIQLIGTPSVSLVLYSILDALVDAYFPILDEISDRIEELEDRIFGQLDPGNQQELFQLKKNLLAMRRVIAPERDVLNELLRPDTPVFDASTAVYFRDVYDHIIRLTDELDTYRDLLSSAAEVHLSVVSNRLNEVMKTLTAWTIILMSVTLVASIYGMNFVHIPELHWRFGYAWALGLMAGIGASIAALFRRIDWL